MDKGQEIMKDLKAGRTNTAYSAPPSLTKNQQKGFMEMVQPFGLEEHVFDKFGREIIHGRKPETTQATTEKEAQNAAKLQDEAQKKWDDSVNSWVGVAGNAFKHRKLQQKTLRELNNGTQNLLHAIHDIDHSKILPVGLNVRKAVGILVHDSIESLRMQASPYKPSQSLKAQSNMLRGLQSRQRHAAAIIRGIFEDIPEAKELLNDDMIFIIGRNEKEHGKGYFMKTYAENRANEAETEDSESIIKDIAMLYKFSKIESEEKRKNRHAKSMDTLIGALSAQEQTPSPTLEKRFAPFVLPRASSYYRNSTQTPSSSSYPESGKTVTETVAVATKTVTFVVTETVHDCLETGSENVQSTPTPTLSSSANSSDRRLPLQFLPQPTKTSSQIIMELS